MSVFKAPSGRYRATVYDPATGRYVAVSTVLNRDELNQLGAVRGTFTKRNQAQRAVHAAAARLEDRHTGRHTVAEWRHRWLSDPLFAGHKKESTLEHDRERTLAFSKRHGDLLLGQVDDLIVAGWIAQGRNRSTVPSLRSMFSAAMSAKAGRLITVNPWEGLGLHKSIGNRDRRPPDLETLAALVARAREVTPPSFADWFEFGCKTGLRCGELDGLKWADLDLEHGEGRCRRQWNARTRKMTTPKYGPYDFAIPVQAAQVLEQAKRDHDSPYVFTTLRGHHYAPSTRNHHWNRVRAHFTGLEDLTLYLATRHHFGWWALNVLRLPPHVIAQQLGHKDGGRLVMRLYGHPDAALNRDRLRDAAAQHAEVPRLHDRRKERKAS